MPDRQDPAAPADLVELGRIVSAYGVLGWLKIQPYSVQAETLLKITTWWLKAPVPNARNADALARPRAAAVRSCRQHGATLVAQLDSVADRDQAEALKGYTVWASRADFAAAGPDEYYWVDLIGCQLFGDDHGRSALIGSVLDVVDNGAHGILRVARLVADQHGDLQAQTDEKGRAVEVLVPFVNAHVHAVDIAGRRIDSNWPVEF